MASFTKPFLHEELPSCIIPTLVTTGGTATGDFEIDSTILFVHGGRFHQGDMHSHTDVAQKLASLGHRVVRCTFPCGKDAPYETGRTIELLAAVATMLQSEFGSSNIGLCGSSSGGFLAMKLCHRLPIFKFCLLLCPVANPATRARYLSATICEVGKSASVIEEEFLANGLHTKAKAEEILAGQSTFFSNGLAEMDSASFELRSRPPMFPPTLVVLGRNDLNVPLAVVSDLIRWADRTIVVGGGHEIQDVIPSDENDYLTELGMFIRRACRAKTEQK